MTTTYHTPIPKPGDTGYTLQAINAAKVNAPLSELDTAIASSAALLAVLQASAIVGGTAVTLTSGITSESATTVDVDSTANFVAGCHVEYALTGGTLERNTVATVVSATRLTMTTSVGTGGIADNTPIAVIPAGFANASAGIYNVLDYGAVGDDVHDDTLAIQAAITAAGKGVVYLPDGTYKITAPLTFAGSGNSDGVIVRGAGRRNTIIKNYGTGTAAFITPAVIRGLTIEHLNVANQSVAGDCITLTANFGHIRLIDLLLFPGTAGYGVNGTAGNGIDIYMEMVRVQGGTDGFYLGTNGGTAINQVTLSDCYANATSSGAGFRTLNILDALFLNCKADSCTYGFRLSGNNTLIGCTVEANTTNGFHIVGSGKHVLINCNAYNQVLPYSLNSSGASVHFIKCHASSTPGSGAGLSIGAYEHVVWDGLSTHLDGGFAASATAAFTAKLGDGFWTTGTYQQLGTVNGAAWRMEVISEAITLNTSGATTDSTADLLPANSIIEAVVARVTTTITMSTAWALGDATTAERFLTATSDLTATTTKYGYNHMQGSVSADVAGPVQTSAGKLRVTTTGTPGAGVIRVSVFYRKFVAPTS